MGELLTDLRTFVTMLLTEIIARIELTADPSNQVIASLQGSGYLRDRCLRLLVTTNRMLPVTTL